MSTHQHKAKAGGYTYRAELSSAEADVNEAVRTVEAVAQPNLPVNVLMALFKVTFLLFRALLHIRSARDITYNEE